MSCSSEHGCQTTQDLGKRILKRFRHTNVEGWQANFGSGMRVSLASSGLRIFHLGIICERKQRCQLNTKLLSTEAFKNLPTPLFNVLGVAKTLPYTRTVQL